MDAGIDAYGIDARKQTSPSNAIATITAAFKILVAKGIPNAPRTDAHNPKAQTTGKNGAHATFASSPIRGSTWKIEHAYNCDRAFAEMAIDSALDASLLRAMGVDPIKDPTSGANNTIPAVDSAESANEIETEATGDASTMAKIPTPSAF